MLNLVENPIYRFSGNAAQKSFGTVRDKVRRAVRDNSWNIFNISRVVSVHLSQLVFKTYQGEP